MRHLIPIILTCLVLFTGYVSKAQSFSDLLVQSEQVKAEYGETDDRYLDALSKAIQAAFGEQKNEDANTYRQIHAGIVKEKYGENSLEYAEDLWRLGNVSEFKGEEYTFNCYKKAERIYEALNAQQEFPYSDIMYRLYLHYYDTQKWYIALNYLKKYISLYEPWTKTAWKGNQYSISGFAHAYLLLGRLYQYNIEDPSSASEAYEKSVIIIEENQLQKDYDLAWMAYHGVVVNSSDLKDFAKASEWQKKYLELIEEIEGEDSERYLQGLSYLRYLYWDLNDLDSIKRVSSKLLTKIESKDNKEGIPVYKDSLYISTQKELVSFCGAFQDFRGIIESSIQTLNTLENAALTDTPDYFDILDGLLIAYHNTGNYLEAYSLYDRYESLASRLGLTESDVYWSYLALKAEALTSLYKTEEHEKTVQDLRILTPKLYGPNSNQALLFACQVANQHESLEQHNEAKSGLDECYRILDSGDCTFENRADSLLIMAVLHNLEGLIYIHTDPEKAEDPLLASIEEDRLIGRRDHTAISNLGLLYYQYKRDFKKAGMYFEQAKDVLEKSGDNYSIQYINILNNLGLCYQELGMNSLAITIFDLASQTVLANYGKQHATYGLTEQNKSVFFFHISNYKEAINCCKNALECIKHVYGEDSEKYAVCLQNLGMMYQSVQDYSTSKELLLSAIPILVKTNSLYAISAYSNLLTVYAMEKDGDRAADLAEIAEAKLKENHWEETDIAATFYGTLGYALLVNGNPKAKEYFWYALNLLGQSSTTSNIQYHSGLLYYGLSAFLDQSQSEDIIPVLTESYKSQYLNNAAFFNGDERESLIAGPCFSQTQNMLFSSRKEGEQDTFLYDFLLFNKGLLLGTSISYAKAVYDSGNEEVISQYEKLQRLKRFLNGEKLTEFDGLSTDDARSQSSALERELTLYLRQNGGYTDGLNYTFSDIQKALGNNEIAIEFVSFLNYADNTSYYAAILAQHGWQEPKYVQLCKKEDLEKLISISPDRLYGETAASENAFKLLWEPLTPYLSNIKAIYFSPAGYINKLAIEHLFNGEKRLDALYNIVRVSSTREICANKPQYKYATAVLYGGLKYDEDDATMIAESRNIRGTVSTRPSIFRGFDSSSTRKGWEYLPGTLDEVNQISSIISKNKITCYVYTSGKGNEESFKALSGNNIGILHIATHGFYMTESQAERNDFFASNPFATQRSGVGVSPLQRSGLLLAGGNKAWKGEVVPEGVEDGVLTAAEIASLDMNSCDVVVLSACETGLGEITDEGVFGLQRAFKNAGVNTIIMSLWEVDDQATSLMMQTFYSNLMKGKSKRDSFSAAQNEVRKKYADPRYWAAFIMLD